MQEANLVLQELPALAYFRGEKIPMNLKPELVNEVDAKFKFLCCHCYAIIQLEARVILN